MSGLDDVAPEAAQIIAARRAAGGGEGLPEALRRREQAILEDPHTRVQLFVQLGEGGEGGEVAFIGESAVWSGPGAPQVKVKVAASERLGVELARVVRGVAVEAASVTAALLELDQAPWWRWRRRREARFAALRLVREMQDGLAMDLSRVVRKQGS